MTKSCGRVLVVFFAMASFILASCTDQTEPVQDISNFDGAGSKTQDNLVLPKPLVPNAVSEVASTAPTPSIVTKNSVAPTAQTFPPTSETSQTFSPSPAPDISQLIGVNSDRLNRLLGKPLLVRQEAEAEVWQYRAANCVLHLFFYLDAANKPPYRLVHVEANHRKRINNLRASAELTLLEQTKLLKSCVSRLFLQARNLENPS